MASRTNQSSEKIVCELRLADVELSKRSSIAQAQKFVDEAELTCSRPLCENSVSGMPNRGVAPWGRESVAPVSTRTARLLSLRGLSGPCSS